MKPLYEHIIASVCALIVVAYMVFGLWMSHTQMPPKQCKAIQVIIADEQVRQYVPKTEIQQVVMNKGLNPVGKTQQKIGLQGIEDVVKQHAMVRTAECYRTMQGDVQIRLTQRVPLIRVVTAAETYFVDTDRKLMPVRESVKTPVLIVSGNVSKRVATTKACNFATWLHDNAYWRTRLARVEVCGPQMIQLIQDKGAATIVLGNWDNYERKLYKLQHWYEADTLLHQQQYPRVDVRFYGQVIGIKPD